MLNVVTEFYSKPNQVFVLLKTNQTATETWREMEKIK